MIMIDHVYDHNVMHVSIMFNSIYDVNANENLAYLLPLAETSPISCALLFFFFFGSDSSDSLDSSEAQKNTVSGGPARTRSSPSS